MAAGGANRNVKVTIGGNADGVKRAFDETADEATGFAGRMKAAGRNIDLPFAQIGATAAKAGAMIGVAAVGASAAVGGIGLAAAGVPLALAGIGVAFAAQNLAVAGAFGQLKSDLTTGMQEATASFVPLMLESAGKIRSTFDGLKPTLTGLFEQAAPMASQLFDGAMSGVREFVSLLPGILTAVAPLITSISGSIGPLADALGGILQSAADQLAGPLGQAIESILPTLTTLLQDIVTTVGPIAAQLFEALGPILETLGGALGDVLKEMGPALTDVFVKLLPPLQKVLDALAPLLPMIADLAGTVLVSLAEMIAPVVEAMAPFITQLIEQLKPVIDEITPIITDLGKELGPLMAENIKEIMPVLLDLTEALLPIIPPIVDIIAQFLIFEQQSKGALIGAIKEIWHWLEEVIPPVFARFMDGLSRIGGWAQTIGGWIGDAWEFIENAIGTTVAWFEGTVLPKIQWVFGAVSGVFTWLKDTASEVWDSIWSKVETVIGFFTGIRDRMWSALTGIWDGLKNGLVDALNAVIYLWNNFELTTPDVPGTDWGGQRIQTPDIDYLTYHTGASRVSFPNGAPEGLAMLRRGETVLTPNDRSGGGDIYLQVIPVDGKYMVRELADHERAGGSVPWAKARRR